MMKGGVFMGGTGSGHKPLKKKEVVTAPATLRCMCCGNEFNSKEFYGSDSELHRAVGKIPYCRECLDTIYQHYLDKYRAIGYVNAERKAIERICMTFDLYYSDKIFDAALKNSNTSKYSGTPLLGLYFRQVKLYQYRNKNYDTTIREKYKTAEDGNTIMTLHNPDDSKLIENVDTAIKLFGKGFEADDYVYLYDQYCDWTARHECNTKAQEEVFKNICVTQLQLLKATRSGGDTKDLAVQLQKWLDTGKLQPKQNANDAGSDAQTFGTLIDKWENTRPIPEVDDELKDVDKIGLYIDVFFRGHLCKMMGLKNSLSDLYDKYMKKYTVDKPEYDADESDEALFEAIFGRDLEDEE